jgi:hypothetical protein
MLGPSPTTLRAVLPDWLDAERLEWIILAVIAGLLVSVYVVVSVVRKVVTKFLLLLVIAGLGVSLWLQRADLRTCAETCQCTLYGESVELPEHRRPERCNQVP